MKILFIYLGTLKSSGSGVIRNRAFIQGALENDHTVDVVMLDDHLSINYDENVVLNNIHKIQLIKMGCLYKLIVQRRHVISVANQSGREDNRGLKGTLKNEISRFLKHIKYITSFDDRPFKN